MKKRFFTIIILTILAIAVLFGAQPIYKMIKKQTQEPVSIMIASDIHYLASEYTGEYFKEPSSMFDGKLTHYSNEYFDAFLAEVMVQQPEILILSGDLTLNGSVRSHEEVAEKLKAVQDAGISVLVIPGNHDVRTTAGDYSKEEPEVVENLSNEDFSKLYENFGPAQAISRDVTSFSYIYQVNPYLRIVMLDTNFGTKGLISDETLVWLEQQLKDAQENQIDVIAVSHQNLHIHNEKLYFSYQMYNADELLTLYETYDVKLNLSGHIHVQSIVTDSTVPEVAVGSLGICGTPYGNLFYDGKIIEYTTTKTDVSAYASTNDFADENLLDFNNYSIYYFEEVARLQATDQFAESGLSSEEIALLAETYATINSAYFMGETLDTSNLTDGLALWETQQDNFIYEYIQTMLKEIQTDNQTLTIDLYIR